MLIKEKTKTVYTTTDGDEFTELDEAIKWQMRLNLNQWADKVGLCRGGEWDEIMVIDAIIDSHEEFKNILLWEKYVKDE